MISFLQNLALFSAIYFFSSPQGMSFWWAHLLIAIFTLLNLHRVSNNYAFLACLVLALTTAMEPRLSVEYIIIAAACLGFAANPWWQNKSEEERKWILLVFFALLYIFDFKKMCFYERGSLLLWFPVFLTLYFNKTTKSDYISYIISGVLLSFNSKKTVMLGYASSLTKYLKWQYLILIAATMVGISFLFIEKIQRFIDMSLLSRIFIWKSTLIGWFDKIIWGHGFGNFAIDFPPFRAHGEFFGTKTNQQVGHGHGLFTHFLFEQGLFGLALCVLLFYLIYKKARPAFLPLLVIAIFDAPLVVFNQYLIAALVLIPFFKDVDLNNKKFSKVINILVYALATVVLSISVVGHYYYDQQRIEQAIKWDPLHPLYHFSRGSDLLNLNEKESLKNFKQAAKLAPNVSYFHGFLAAAQLANRQASNANWSIDRALAMDGGEAHWHVVKAFANYPNKPVFKQHLTIAVKQNKEIPFILKNPQYPANAYIGRKGSDARVSSFYRRGKPIYMPLPYFPGEFPTEVKEIIKANRKKN